MINAANVSEVLRDALRLKTCHRCHGPIPNGGKRAQLPGNGLHFKDGGWAILAQIGSLRASKRITAAALCRRCALSFHTWWNA